eukprot:14664060-Alexandrium_andersonii.AAC.1
MTQLLAGRRWRFLAHDAAQNGPMVSSGAQRSKPARGQADAPLGHPRPAKRAQAPRFRPPSRRRSHPLGCHPASPRPRRRSQGRPPSRAPRTYRQRASA